MRTDKEIVIQTLALARKLYALRGYQVTEGYRFDTSTHPQEREAWSAACAAQMMLTDTDPMDALANLEDEGLALDSNDWTDADNEAAMGEGWALFENDGVQEIQRDDEAGVFPSDEEAIAFVKAANSLHAIKARKIAGV